MLDEVLSPFREADSMVGVYHIPPAKPRTSALAVDFTSYLQSLSYEHMLGDFGRLSR